VKSFISRGKSILPRFLVTTIIGLAFGIAVGYVSSQNKWGLGFPTAIGMVLGCAYGVEIIHAATAAYLFPEFEKYPRDKKFVLQMSSSILVHVLGWLLLVWVAGLILNTSIFKWQVLMWLGIYIVIVIIGTSVRQLLNFRQELRQKDLLEERLKALASQAELKALKAQINPHFLFNSLNTVASLTNTDPRKAEEAILMLADVFRYTLSSSNREFVTLQDELDFLDSYLDVEKARFGDRLEVAKSVQPEILSTPIPSLILQPLVENCLKHGTTKEGKAKIEIRCYLDGDTVNIEVRDQGRGVPEEVKKGIYTKGTGLRIVNERLLKLYGDGYGLKMKDNSPSGTIAMVTIPREKA
jgi:sensor histidine kinase YesM